MSTINIKEKLDLIKDYWCPKIVGEFNGQKIELAKIKGEFVWHKHENEDEVFYVIKGTLLIHFRDRTEEITEGNMIVIPKGVEHKSEAREETHIILIEPMGTRNTGNVVDEDKTATEETI